MKAAEISHLFEKYGEVMTAGEVAATIRANRLFLKNNRITYNEICRECLRDCKQAHTATVVCCPNFITGREGRDIS